MRKYETVVLARQDISFAQVDGLTDHFSKLIESLGGKVVHSEYCGLKSLAYRIRKGRKAHFTLMDIEAPPPAIHEMERLMRINEDILRFLTVKVDAFGTRPSALMQSRYYRDETKEPEKEGGAEGEKTLSAESGGAPRPAKEDYSKDKG